MNVKKLITWAGIAVLVAIVVVWEVTPLVLPAGNPPARHAGVIVSERSDAILRRGCFDCHSNETQWPWYSVAPVAGLLVRYDVFQGRSEMNLSEWSTMTSRRQQRQFPSAWGPTKKEAEQKAARLALSSLGEVDETDDDEPPC